MWLCYHLRVTDIHKYVNRCVLSVYAKYIYLHILLLPPILWVKKERLLLFSSHSLLEIQVSNLKRVTSPYWLLFSPSLPPCKKTRKQVQNGVADAKLYATKLRLHYSFSTPRNGIWNQSIRSHLIGTSQVISLMDPYRKGK